MSKARVDWAFQELITSSKLDEMVLDDLRAGRTIFKVMGGWNPSDDTSPILHWHLYNPAKIVNDRLRLYGSVFTPDATPAGFFNYSLDGGGSWVALPLASGTDTGVDITLGEGDFLVNVDLLYWDIDLSGILSTQYIGIQAVAPSNPPRRAAVNAWGILYLASETPF